MADEERQTVGRRQYDRANQIDHDLLVRIDERLAGHLVAFSAFVTQHARDSSLIEARLASLEQTRAEGEGATRANARTIAAIVAGSSALTALAVKVAEKLV